MGNPVVHWELWSGNPERVSQFYADVFGWQIQAQPQMNYRYVHTQSERGINGGIIKPESGPMPGNMTFYIDVDDLAEYRLKIIEAGGRILVEEIDVPGMGSFSLFEDPEGRVVGIWCQSE
jgi:uncharacterized protein